MSETRTPAHTANTAPSNRAEFDGFLAEARRHVPKAGQGRLVFALDATMSRQPTWDRACRLQAEMFHETARLGGLAVQLVYFRGFRECRASRWAADPKALAELMSGIGCRGGYTQIGRVLAHVRNNAAKERIGALVYVGDAMEEKVDDLCQTAGELGLLGTPCFMFQEGRDAVAERAFREIARLTKGAYCRFDAASASELGRLLRAAAAYAAGGHAALEDLSKRGDGSARHLLAQMR